MKTTIDIADDLFQQAKEVARRRKTTLRTLVEAGLRDLLARPDPLPSYTLPDLRTGKRGGFRPEFVPQNWSKIRQFVHAEREERILRGMSPKKPS